MSVMSMLIEQLEHERHREEQRAEGYLLLLGLALDQLHDARQQLRLADDRHVRLIEECRTLREQLMEPRITQDFTSEGLTAHVTGNAGNHITLAAFVAAKAQQHQQREMAQ